jgi:hypothetical protein
MGRLCGLKSTKLDIGKAFWPSRLTIRWNTNAFNVAVLAKDFPKLILIDTKAKIPNKENARCWALRVAERLCPIFTDSALIRRSAFVNIDGSSINLLPVHFESLFNSICGCEVNVAKTARLPGRAIRLHLSRDNFAAGGKFLCKPIVVHIP